MTEQARQGALVSATVGVFIPPAATFAFGAAVGWVLSGFRRRQAGT
jgi:hypothetical protein